MGRAGGIWPILRRSSQTFNSERAIASVVREYVPPASLSSIAAKETGDAVRKLLGRAPGGGKEWSKVSGVASAASHGVGNVVNGIVNGMGIVVGMDEATGMDEL